MSIPEKVTVTATVKSREELEDGWKLTLDVPSFKSKYPTVVYGCPVADGGPLKAGTSHSIVLERGKKQKEDYSGDAYWHHNWRWGGLSGRGPVLHPVAAPTDAPSAPEGSHEAPDAGNGHSGARTDPTGISIERQVSLKTAVELTIARIAAGHYKAEDRPTYHVVQVADFFARWLRGQVDVKALAPTAQPPQPQEEQEAPQ